MKDLYPKVLKIFKKIIMGFNYLILSYFICKLSNKIINFYIKDLRRSANSKRNSSQKKGTSLTHLS